MKNKKTTILVGIGIILTTTLLLLFKRNKEDNQNVEEENRREEETPKEDEKNKAVVNEVLKELVDNENFNSTFDLLTNLIREVVNRTKDVYILYDTPRNIEELEELLVILNLYDRVNEILRENREKN